MLRGLTVDSSRHNLLARGCNPFYFCFVTLIQHKTNFITIQPIAMNLILLTLAALLTIGSSKTNAQDMNVSAAVTNSFHSSFKNASGVQWKDGGSYYKADFEMNGQFVSAYYDQNAHLMAVTKNITTVQLPVTLQASLKKSYADY